MANKRFCGPEFTDRDRFNGSITHQSNQTITSSTGFKPAEPSAVVVARYDAKHVSDHDRKVLKEHIEEIYKCTAWKDGTNSDKGHDATVINVEEKSAGFLAFDFKLDDCENALQCENDLNEKELLGITLRVKSLFHKGWEYFDGCCIRSKKNPDVWFLSGRKGGIECTMRFDAPQAAN